MIVSHYYIFAVPNQDKMKTNSERDRIIEAVIAAEGIDWHLGVDWEDSGMSRDEWVRMEAETMVDRIAKPITVDYAAIHRACQHIKYHIVKHTNNEHVFLLVNKKEVAVAMVEVEAGQVIITQ